MSQEKCCYILYSKKLGKYYIGSCQANVNERIAKHNASYYGSTKFTSLAKDWELYIKIDVEAYSHAIRIERKIKKMKSKKYIENLKLYPELIEKIKLETKSN